MAVGMIYELEVERAPATARRARRVVYPTSDGEPMAETGKHVSLMVYSLSALSSYYAHAQDSVYVAGNNFLYYEEGNPKARLSPDTYIVFGVRNWERDSYKTWEEGNHTPAVVFEFTSKKTKDEDLVKKYQLYEQVLKVPEYFLFNPTNDYIAERLRGFRLEGGRYVPIVLTDGRHIHSDQMNLDLVVDGQKMRLFDPQAGRFLPSVAEAEALANEAEARAAAEGTRAAAEATRAEEAEAEVARLRAEIAALRGG